jgi:hypothetical protein
MIRCAAITFSKNIVNVLGGAAVRPFALPSYNAVSRAIHCRISS